MSKDKLSAEEIAIFRDAVDGVEPMRDDKPQKTPTQAPEIAADVFETLINQAFTEMPPEPQVVPDFDLFATRTKPAHTPLAASPERARSLGSEDSISYTKPGVQHKVLRKLKKGQPPPENELDLHGLTIDEANDRIVNFLADAHSYGYKCIRIIHGKSHRKAGQMPVLKNFVNECLRHREDVLAFCSAAQRDGGTGAVNVLLKNLK